LGTAAYFGESRRAFAEALETWETAIVRQVAPSTATRYAVSLGQLQPFLDGLYPLRHHRRIRAAELERTIRARELDRPAVEPTRNNGRSSCRALNSP
jgi:hypothetical protein